MASRRGEFPIRDDPVARGERERVLSFGPAPGTAPAFDGETQIDALLGPDRAFAAAAAGDEVGSGDIGQGGKNLFAGEYGERRGHWGDSGAGGFMGSLRDLESGPLRGGEEGGRSI